MKEEIYAKKNDEFLLKQRMKKTNTNNNYVYSFYISNNLAFYH